VLYRFGFYLLIAVSPLLLGSNRPLFWGVNGVLSALVLVGFVWSEFKKEPSRFDWKLPFMAIFCFLLIGMWMALQALPWTPKAWHHPIWFASPMLAGARSTISADPSQTWQTLAWWSTLSVFIVAVRLGTSARRSIFVLNLMLTVCVLVALFGFTVESFELNTVGLIEKTYYKGWLTGTFDNRNSAASFLEIGLIIAVALAGREYLIRRKHRARGNVLGFVDIVVGQFGIYSAVGLVLFFALLLTGSRGGIATGIFGGALVLILRLLKQGRPTVSSITVMLVGLTLSIVLAISAVQGRQDIADNTNVRLSLYAEALKATADRPLLGHGAGAYSSVQPLYHSSSTPSDLLWDNAHSTVLEAVVALGFPAMIFATTVLFFILVKLVKVWGSTRKEATCLLVIQGVGAAVTLHAFADFSLEIQAIALYVSCLIGLGIGEAMRMALESRQQAAKTNPAN
jgi:O-antigen ligase